MTLLFMPARCLARWRLVVLLALMWASADARPATQWITAARQIMGTAIDIQIEASDPALGQRLCELVFAEMERINQRMSPYLPDSELSRINALASQSPVLISTEQFDLIERALQVSRQTHGAFDITYASVGYLYDYQAGVQPSADTVSDLLPAINYRHVRLDPNAYTVAFTHDNVRIDLGGIAKGHAVDRAIALLQQQGVQRAMVSAGGDSRILGDRHGRPWYVGVKHPRRPGAVEALLPLADTAVSTSGDYERYFETAAGNRVHHILNPRTGRPAEPLSSVTVIAPDATTSDALSTSVFVLGPESGMALIESLDGIEAVLIDRDGAVHFSSCLQRH